MGVNALGCPFCFSRLKRELKLRFFLLIICPEPSSVPQNDRLRLTGSKNTRAFLVIKQPFLRLDLSNVSFIHDLTI